MSADDLIRDPATIRASDEPDRDDRYWAAITRDRSVGSVDAVTRLADSEQAATNNRLDQAEGRINDLLTERDELRASVTEYEGSLQAAQSRLAIAQATIERAKALPYESARLMYVDYPVRVVRVRDLDAVLGVAP